MKYLILIPLLLTMFSSAANAFKSGEQVFQCLVEKVGNGVPEISLEIRDYSSDLAETDGHSKKKWIGS